MKDYVCQVKSERLAAPHLSIKKVAEDEERSKEHPVCLAPGYGQVTFQNLSDLRKIVRQKKVVRDWGVSSKPDYHKQREDEKREAFGTRHPFAG